MNELPQQKLRELIATYGRSLCDDARRCEALLKDLCGAHKAEIYVLIEALKARVPRELMGAGTGVPAEVLRGRAASRLQTDLGMAKENAEWAVESWAIALGLPPAAARGKGSSGSRATTRERPPAIDDKAPSAGPRTTLRDPRADTGTGPTRTPTVIKTPTPPAKKPPITWWLVIASVVVLVAGVWWWQGRVAPSGSTLPKTQEKQACIPRGSQPPLGSWRYCD